MGLSIWPAVINSGWFIILSSMQRHVWYIMCVRVHFCKCDMQNTTPVMGMPSGGTRT